jgi:hypothetical protein
VMQEPQLVKLASSETDLQREKKEEGKDGGHGLPAYTPHTPSFN